MSTIYIFSGLGVDERVFRYLDFSGMDVRFIHWIRPLPDESIKLYAQRLRQQIVTDKPILIGLSFGGIIAVEVGRLISGGGHFMTVNKAGEISRIIREILVDID